MKAISTTLYIVVAAVVILVAALVILTIFGGGIQPVVDVTQARNICIQQGTTVCKSTQNLPPTWSIPTMNTNEGLKSCNDLVTECGDNPTCKTCELLE